MTAAIRKSSEVQMLENIIAEKGTAERELTQALEQLKAKDEENAKLKEDVKMFEPYREILEAPKIDFYNIKLSGSATMDWLIMRAAKLYGRRFKLETESGEDRRYARLKLSTIVSACVHFVVSNESRWNQVQARYLSRVE